MCVNVGTLYGKTTTNAHNETIPTLWICVSVSWIVESSRVQHLPIDFYFKLKREHVLHALECLMISDSPTISLSLSLSHSPEHFHTFQENGKENTRLCISHHHLTISACIFCTAFGWQMMSFYSFCSAQSLLTDNEILSQWAIVTHFQHTGKEYHRLWFIGS